MHPLTLDSLNNLAVVMERQGDLRPAIKTHQDCLRVTHDLLGAKHPDYLTSENNLGTVRFRYARQLADEGQSEAAMAMFTQARGNYQAAMLGRKEVLGDDHAFYEASLYNLARLELETQRYDSAVSRYREVLDADVRRRGRKHGVTQATVAELAESLVGHRKYREATTLLDEAIESCAKRRAWHRHRLKLMRGLCWFAESNDPPDELEVAFTFLQQSVVEQPVHVVRSTRVLVQHIVSLTQADPELRRRWADRLNRFGTATEAP